MHPTLPILRTPIHGIFSNPRFTRAYVDFARQSEGLPRLAGPLPSARKNAEENYERLARVLSEQTSIAAK